MSRMTIVTSVPFSCAVVFVLCVFVVCPAIVSLVTREFFFGGFWGGGESDGLKKVLTQGDFCAVL